MWLFSNGVVAINCSWNAAVWSSDHLEELDGNGATSFRHVSLLWVARSLGDETFDNIEESVYH